MRLIIFTFTIILIISLLDKFIINRDLFFFISFCSFTLLFILYFLSFIATSITIFKKSKLPPTLNNLGIMGLFWKEKGKITYTAPDKNG